MPPGVPVVGFLFSPAPGGSEALPMEIGLSIPAIVLELAALI
jgi:hypothetical protein